MLRKSQFRSMLKKANSSLRVMQKKPQTPVYRYRSTVKHLHVSVKSIHYILHEIKY